MNERTTPSGLTFRISMLEALALARESAEMFFEAVDNGRVKKKDEKKYFEKLFLTHFRTYMNG